MHSPLRRIWKRADDSEDIHMETVIDQDGWTQFEPLTGDCTGGTGKEEQQEKDVLFDDSNNPNTVSNCLSPFIPTSSERIGDFLPLLRLWCPYNAEFGEGDVILDTGLDVSAAGTNCVLCWDLSL